MLTGTTEEVHHQLLGLTGVDVEAVLLAPFQKVLVQFSVLPVIVGRDESDDCRVIRELLQVDVVGVVIEPEGNIPPPGGILNPSRWKMSFLECKL